MLTTIVFTTILCMFVVWTIPSSCTLLCLDGAMVVSRSPHFRGFLSGLGVNWLLVSRSPIYALLTM